MSPKAKSEKETETTTSAKKKSPTKTKKATTASKTAKKTTKKVAVKKTPVKTSKNASTTPKKTTKAATSSGKTTKKATVKKAPAKASNKTSATPKKTTKAADKKTTKKQTSTSRKKKNDIEILGEDFDALLSQALEIMEDGEGAMSEASNDDTFVVDAPPPQENPDEDTSNKPMTSEFLASIAKKTQGSLRRKAKTQEQKMLQERRPHLEILAWRDAKGESVVEHNNLLPKNRFNPFISQSSSGWPIQYWAGNSEHSSLMSSAIGLKMYRGMDKEDNTYRGTWRHQAFVTAIEMTVLAYKQGWPGIRVLDGCDFMAWATWATAERIGLPVNLDNCDTATVQDMKKSERTDHMFARILSLNDINLAQEAAPSLAPGGARSADNDDDA